MSNLLFCSDPHLDHRNVLGLRPNFSSVEEHNDIICHNIGSIMSKRDVLYILGDCFFSKKSLNDFAKEFGHYDIRIVLGNHDCKIANLIAKHFKVYGMCKKRRLWLTHSPMHEAELYNKANVHGHVHGSTIEDFRYVNVCMENISYVPVSVHEIEAYIANRKSVHESINNYRTDKSLKFVK